MTDASASASEYYREVKIREVLLPNWVNLYFDWFLFMSAEALCILVILRSGKTIRAALEVIVGPAYAATNTAMAMGDTKQIISLIFATTFAIMMLLLTYAGYLRNPPVAAARGWLIRVACATFLMLSAILGYSIAIA